jgi:hypothetical protein
MTKECNIITVCNVRTSYTTAQLVVLLVVFYLTSVECLWWMLHHNWLVSTVVKVCGLQWGMEGVLGRERG